MSIETLMADLTAALNKNSDHLARVILGQEAAMAKLEGSAPAATRKPRAKKDDEPATGAADTGNSDAAPTAAPTTASTAEASPAAAEPAAKVFTQDDLKAVAMEWRGSTEDEAARKKQNELFLAIAAHLGVAKMTGPEGPQASDDIKQAVFFIRRAMAGKSVDFGADYNFDGDPAQGGAAPAAAEEDPFA